MTLKPAAAKMPEKAVLPVWRVIPAGVWVLGFVSMLMDISSEMIHALLPIYLVTVLGTSALTVGISRASPKQPRQSPRSSPARSAIGSVGAKCLLLSAEGTEALPPEDLAAKVEQLEAQLSEVEEAHDEGEVADTAAVLEEVAQPTDAEGGRYKIR